MRSVRIYIDKMVTALTNGTATVLQEDDKTVISKLREVFRNSVFSISNQVRILGVNFVIALLIARWLGAKSLGQYALETSLVGITKVGSELKKLTDSGK